jgi:lipocalin-like protein
MAHEEYSLVGAWKLVSFEFRKDERQSIDPFGEKAQGSIIYTESGRYSAQLMRMLVSGLECRIKCGVQPMRSKPAIRAVFPISVPMKRIVRTDLSFTS